MVNKIKLSRTLCLEIVDPDPEELLKKLTDANIELEDIVFLDLLTVRLTIVRGNHNHVCAIANHHGATCRVVRKQGILWKITALLYRPVLLWGGGLFLLMIFLLPGRVLRVEVEGNRCVPTQYILYCAEECGIDFGAKARIIRSEQAKNQMLERIPELQWLGINIRGCVAIIEVEERALPPKPEQTAGVANVIASRDGIISDLIVRSGTALCVPGQSVRAGEILISGYSDHGLKVTTTVADGDVFAHTCREIQLVSPVERVIQGELKKKYTCYRLKIGKKVINFCNHSGISHATCDKMYSEYYWALPGGFRLPVSVIKETYCTYDLQTITENETMPTWLEAYSEAYLVDHMIAGEILHGTESLEVAEGAYKLKGIYFCREMIGKVRYEEIVENHAENN